MDPQNDIYGYAQQAGMIPDFGIDPSVFEQPAPAPRQSQFSPYTGTMTDEDILAHFAPGATDTAAPEPVVAEPAAPIAPPQPQQIKEGTSVSQSGYSPTKNAQVRKGPGARLDQEIANIETRGAAEAQDRMVGPAAAAQGEMEAAHGEATANADLITAEGHQLALLAKLKQDYDGQTQELIAGEQGKAAQAKTNYIAALNDFRAARVNPAQLWDHSTAGERIGTLAVAFVTDFLGVKGIHTSAMATLNKAIDRNIDAQVRGIQTKGEVAQGFKGLWDMQMQESNSMQETRLRMRGFMLDSAKTAIESNMSQYQAALASAKGQSAIAKIDQELQKTVFEINKHQDAATGQRISQAIQRHGDELKASMDAARLSVERERLNIEKGKNGGGSEVGNLIYDNSKSGGGHARWIFKPGVQDKEKGEYRSAQEDTNHVTDLIGEYQSLHRKYGNQELTAATRWSSTDDKRLRAIANEIFMIRQKAVTGAAATNKEAERIATGTPEALFSSKGDIAPVLADTERRMREKLSRKREVVAFDLPEGHAYRSFKSSTGTEGEAEVAEAKLVGDRRDQEKELEKLIQGGRVKGLEKHSAREPISTDYFDVPKDVKEDHTRFIQAHPELPVREGDVTPGKALVLSSDGKTPPKEVDAAEAASYKKRGFVVREAEKYSDIPLNYEGALTGLARDAAGYKGYAADGSKQDERRYQENVALLKHIAAPVLTGTRPNDPEGLYALMKLQDLGEDVATEHPADPVTTSVTYEEAPPEPKKRKK